MCGVLRPPLPLHLQLRRGTEPDVVFPIRDECCHQLHSVHILRLLLLAAGRFRAVVRSGAAGGDYVLCVGLDTHMYFGKCTYLLTARQGSCL